MPWDASPFFHHHLGEDVLGSLGLHPHRRVHKFFGRSHFIVRFFSKALGWGGCSVKKFFVGELFLCTKIVEVGFNPI